MFDTTFALAVVGSGFFPLLLTEQFIDSSRGSEGMGDACSLFAEIELSY